jgi:hypothetical protein
MKRFVVILLLACVLLGVWLSMGIARVLRAESDVVERFHALVDFYVVSNAESLPAFLTVPELNSEQRSLLERIHNTIEAIAATGDDSIRYTLLRDAQRNIREFLLTTNLPDALTGDESFHVWSKNMTNLGDASTMLKQYNDALGLYIALKTSVHGTIVGLWRQWNQQDFLRIDGSTETTPQVSF